MKNDNTSFIPQRPFSEKELMQKPRPVYAVLIKDSMVNYFNLENYGKSILSQKESKSEGKATR